MTATAGGDELPTSWPTPSPRTTTGAAAAVAPPEWLVRLAAAAGTRDAEAAAAQDGPDDRIDGRRSAVLVLLGEDERGPTVLLTGRAQTLRSHAGQPSFPGGRIDPTDAGPVEAALREAHEETGLDPAGVQVLGVLADRGLAVNHARVTPVLAWWHRPSAVRVVDRAEVESVHVVAVAELVDPANRLQVSHPSGYVGPAFRAAGMLVWGFTALLLTELLALGGLDRPWDPNRVEPLPSDVVAQTMRDRAAAEVDEPRTGTR